MRQTSIKAYMVEPKLLHRRAKIDMINEKRRGEGLELLHDEADKDLKLHRQASLVMGKEAFLSMPPMTVPDHPIDGGTPLTYGWVLQINLFLRQLLTSLCLASFSDNPPICLGNLTMIYFFLLIQLCWAQPYQSRLILLTKASKSIAFETINY
jgi:hypothetical protein